MESHRQLQGHIQVMQFGLVSESVTLSGEEKYCQLSPHQCLGQLWPGEEALKGGELLEVDFGDYLGIQTVARAACIPDNSPTLRLNEEIIAQPLVEDGNEGIFAQPELLSVLVRAALPSHGLLDWELEDNDSAHDWDPTLSDLGSEAGSFSSGASPFDDQEDDPFALLGELGVYSLGPNLEMCDLEHKYADSNWHARTWSLLSRFSFAGKTLGTSEHLPSDRLLQPIEYFLLFWDETLQWKIVRESNSYANYVDPATGKRKGGESAARSITLEEFRQFTGICCLMGVQDQPCIRDYWRRNHGALYYEVVATTMSRWRFEYILRCLYMTSKSDFITNKRSPDYNPISKCRWIFEHVQVRFQQFWNLSPFVIVDECMVAYNGTI